LLNTTGTVFKKVEKKSKLTTPEVHGTRSCAVMTTMKKLTST